MAYIHAEDRQRYARSWRKDNPEKCKEYARAYRQRNKDKLLEKNRQRYKAHPEKYRWATIKCSYGLTKEQYEKLMRQQDGKCRICRKPAVHVDHNHKTGKVRGLLCKKCNLGLGLFNDDPEALRIAASYVESLPPEL